MRRCLLSFSLAMSAWGGTIATVGSSGAGTVIPGVIASGSSGANMTGMLVHHHAQRRDRCLCLGGPRRRFRQLFDGRLSHWSDGRYVHVGYLDDLGGAILHHEHPIRRVAG